MGLGTLFGLFIHMGFMKDRIIGLLRSLRARLNGTSHLLSSEAYIAWLRQQGVRVGEGTIARSPRETFVDTQRAALISIGRNVLLHRGTRILAHDYASRVFVNLWDDYIPSQGRVRIGDNVWLGEGVTILKGADIGDNSIIGAGAVVTGHIPANSVAVGTPARVICTLEEYHRRRAERYAEEAIDYALAIYESGRTPGLRDFERDYPAFTDARNWKEHPFTYPELSGERLKRWLARHKAPYAGFEDFMAEVARRRYSESHSREFSHNSPVLSVIVTACNNADVLNKTLDSVLNQTERDLEVIVIDDGSKDNTLSICRSYAATDGRVRVHTQTNRGLGPARNAGLELARGEFIAYVDAGDTVDATMYARLLEEAVRCDADIVSCGHIREEESGELREVRDVDSTVCLEGEDIRSLMPRYITGLTDRSYTMAVWHAIYRRERITGRFLSERDIVSEDLPYQLNALRMARRVVYIPDTLYCYSYSPTSLSHILTVDKVDRYARLADWLKEFFGGEEDGNRIADIFYCSALQNLRRAASLNTTQSPDTLRAIIGRILRDPRRRKAMPFYLRHLRHQSLKGSVWTSVTDRLMSVLPSGAAKVAAGLEARIVSSKRLHP